MPFYAGKKSGKDLRAVAIAGLGTPTIEPVFV